MKALVYRGPFETTLEDVPEPAAEPGSVVVQVAAVGMCGSDVTAFTGHMDTANSGDVRGHEFAGHVVEATGPDERWLGLQVAVNPNVTCGRCGFCQGGADNLCPEARLIGVHRAGAYAERVSVPVRQLVVLPSTVPFTAAATTEPLAQAVHDVRLALRHGTVDTALVIGSGAIGFFVLQAARNLGIGSVAVLEPSPARRASAEAAGADQVFASTEEAADMLRAKPVSAAFDAVGTEATRQLAVLSTRPGGTVILVGLHVGSSSLEFRDVIRREIALCGSMAETAADFHLAAAWLAQRQAGLPSLPAPHDLAEGPALFRELATAGRSELRTFLTAIS